MDVVVGVRYSQQGRELEVVHDLILAKQGGVTLLQVDHLGPLGVLVGVLVGEAALGRRVVRHSSHRSAVRVQEDGYVRHVVDLVDVYGALVLVIGRRDLLHGVGRLFVRELAARPEQEAVHARTHHLAPATAALVVEHAYRGCVRLDTARVRRLANLRRYSVAAKQLSPCEN